MRWIHEKRVHPPDVQILTGAVGNGTKLPVVFLDGPLTARKYLKILQETFIPFLQVEWRFESYYCSSGLSVKLKIIFLSPNHDWDSNSNQISLFGGGNVEPANLGLIRIPF